MRFRVRVDAAGRLLTEPNRPWLLHVPFVDKRGSEWASQVFVTNVSNRTAQETTLRFFWNLNGATGQLVTQDSSRFKHARPGDIYFYGGTFSDMNQSELVLFAAEGHTAGVFRFLVNGTLEYQTPVTCRRVTR